MVKRCLFFIILGCFGLKAQSKLVNHSRQNISLEFQLPEIIAQPIHIKGQDYTRLTYEESRAFVQPGAPIVPFTITRVALPQGATVTLQYNILEQGEMKQINLIPAIIINGTRGEAFYPRDNSIYSGAAPFPGPIVEVSDPYIHRRLRMVDVKIYPVQFNPVLKHVRLIKRISIQLKLKNGQINPGNFKLSKTEKAHLVRRVINFKNAANWIIPPKSNFSNQVNYDFSVGDWFKIAVSEEGIYKISGSFLQSQGLSISNINLDAFQIFNYGGDTLPTSVAIARPGDLNELAIEVQDKNGNGIMDSEDVIYFYGKGVKGWRYNSQTTTWDPYLNPFSFNNYYIFTYNQNNGKRIIPENSANHLNAALITRFTDFHRFEEEKENILKSGLDWYWQRFQGLGEQKSFTFELPQNIFAENGLFITRMKAGSGTRYWDDATYRFTFNMSINGQTIVSNESFTGNGGHIYSKPTNSLKAGLNEFFIDYSGNLEAAYAFLDFFEAHFERPFIAENNFLKFYYIVNPTPSEFEISGLPSGTHRVWETTDFANVRSIIPLQNGSLVRFHETAASRTGKEYYVFSESAVKEVSEVIPIPNSPNLRNPDRKAKLLLIVADDFYQAAEDWENYKESQTLNPILTERVKVSEIYREFSSCLADPTAIRDFIKYAYENWSVNDPNARTEYVQFLGDGSYDYRYIELPSYQNRVPVFEITANGDIFSRVTDNYFTAVNNTSTGFGSLDPQLSHARLPANTTEDITNYLNKLKSYENSYLGSENENGWQTVLTFVADDECTNASNCSEWYHLFQTEAIVDTVPGKFDLTKIYLVDYRLQAGGLGRTKPKASADLLDQINRGTLMINFFGHGDPNTWAHEQVLTKARDLPLIQNGSKLPVWVAATCTWGKYDDPNIPSMAEEMVWSANGGGIASVAASRPTFSFANLGFAEDFYNYLFNHGDDTRRSILVGDAIQFALGGGSNDQKYHFFGDAALQLADPQHIIKIDNISADTLKALSKVTLQASIYDSGDNFLPDFNGKAVVRVFDAKDSLSVTIAGKTINYQYQGGTIFKGIVSVINGKIEEASFIVPKSIKYKNARSGRVSIYAWSDTRRDAAGYDNTLLFFGTESQINDTEGPKISFSFPDQPDFFDGDFVSQQPQIAIRLADENGINLTGEIGHRLELIIDENVKKNVTQFFLYDENEYTRGELNYTLPALSSGKHQLKISAWDNLNNYSEEVLSFTTTNSQELTLEQVVNFPNPFSEDTHFTFQYQSPSGMGDVIVNIYTVGGRLIQKLETIAQPGFNKIYWDGRDRDGDKLANGVYLYKIVVDDGDKKAEKIEKFAIVR